MNELQPVTPISVDNIKSKIHEIRGQKVMLDRDLAELYQVETKQLNRQVKRNIERFPEDFMFQLNDEESDFLRCQFGTSKNTNESNRGGNRYKPYVFTELGISMLSSVLHSSTAIQVNINIMRAFMLMRHNLQFITNQNTRFEKIEHKLDSLSVYIEDVLRDQNDINDDMATQLELINQTLAELQAENAVRKTFQERKPVGFKIEKS
ncbi:MAG: ORF6N domain-containing protein [Bacteroidales bacterium]|nr:ORF6N domain-containing protein [Bacteroidales bacterium]